MTPAELAAYLHEQIPLSRAMQLRVLAVGPDAVRLAAPLEPNRNHHGNAFGGSLAALAVLAGWGWLHARLAAERPGVRLVIQRQSVEYRTAARGDFTADCRAPAAPEWERFARSLARRGRGRIELAAEVTVDDLPVASFVGEYAALIDDGSRGEPPGV